MTDRSITYFVVNKKTLFIPLRYVYGECLSLIAPYAQVSPLICLKSNNCPANVGCMDVLAKRLNYLFTFVAPDVKLIITYFKYRDRPDSIRAGIFDRDLNNPKVIVANQANFKRFQKEGVAFTLYPPDDYWLMKTSNQLLPVKSLLVKPQ